MAPPFMQLHTDTSTLRPWHPGDAQRLFEIQSDPKIMKWLADDMDHPVLMGSVEDAHLKIAQWALGLPAPQGVWAIVPDATGKLTGMVRHEDSKETVQA